METKNRTVFSCESCKLNFPNRRKLAHHNQTNDHQLGVGLTMVDFKQDGAKTEIRNSQQITGQQGLFLLEDVKKGQLINWYYGKSFGTEEELNNHTKQHGQGDNYVFRVPKGSLSTRELYYIDALDTNKEKLCVAAFINHSKKAPNCRYQYALHGKADFGVGVAFIAMYNMDKDTELLFNYGPDYHKRLVQDGILIE